MKKRERNSKRSNERTQKAAVVAEASDSSESDSEEIEIEKLNERIQSIAPARGTQATR